MHLGKKQPSPIDPVRILTALLGDLAAGEYVGVMLEFTGRIPTKKNGFRAAGGADRKNNVVYKDGIREEMAAIQKAIALQWSGGAVLHPVLIWDLDIHEAADRDGAHTTVLDCMVKAGVLVDDNVRNCNGLEIIRPASPPADRAPLPEHRVTVIWQIHNQFQPARNAGSNTRRSRGVRKHTGS